ncbi:unnamed protein product [Lactuca saligna]|uniref:Uncharacterized protein n=1 Tax=Lactuca saligna TaxID=75948 RepID=A0AA36A0S5_LACSI|nr:unnamed protein product [Lactuca saligna]
MWQSVHKKKLWNDKIVPYNVENMVSDNVEECPQEETVAVNMVEETVAVNTVEEEFYMSLEDYVTKLCQIRAFKRFCRKVITVDGAYLKGDFKEPY